MNKFYSNQEQSINIAAQTSQRLREVVVVLSELNSKFSNSNGSGEGLTLPICQPEFRCFTILFPAYEIASQLVAEGFCLDQFNCLLTKYSDYSVEDSLKDKFERITMPLVDSNIETRCNRLNMINTFILNAIIWCQPQQGED